MHLVVAHNWKKEPVDIARTIAEAMGILIFEAQQKIAAGGPAVLTNFADQNQAEMLAAKLSQNGVPAFVIFGGEPLKRYGGLKISMVVFLPMVLP